MQCICSKRNFKAAQEIDAVPLIADNPRRGKRQKVELSWLLKAKRYVIEQFNGHVKDNVLGEFWV